MRQKLVLAAAMSASLVLSGCLGQQQNNANSNPSANRNADAKDVTLTITSNSIAGGKNALGAQWITDYVIPRFTEAEKAKGVNATVKFDGSGADDKEYKTKISLDFNSGGGGDIVEID